MTAIDLSVVVRGLGAGLLGTSAKVTIEAISNNKTRVEVKDEKVIFSKRQTILSDPDNNTFVVELLPSDGSFCYRWRIESLTEFTSITRYTSVPDSPTPVEFADLPDVDPKTFEPTVDVVSAWHAVLTEVDLKLIQVRQASQEVHDDREAVSLYVDDAKESSRLAGISSISASESAGAASRSAGQASESAAIADNKSKDASDYAAAAAESKRLSGLNADAASQSASDSNRDATTVAESLSTIRSIQSDVNDAKTSVDETKTHLDQVKTDVDTVKQGINQSESRIDSAKIDILAADGRVAEADTKITQIQSDIETTQTEINTARDDTLEAKRLIGLDRTAVADDKTVVGNLKTDVANLKSDTNQLKISAEAARDLALAGQFLGSALGSVDLNTVTTPGVYRQGSSASLALNYPIVLLGTLVVYRTAQPAAGDWLTQEYHPVDPQVTRLGRIYYKRVRYDGNWGSWRVYSSQRVVTYSGQPGVDVFTWNDIQLKEQALMPSGIALGSTSLDVVMVTGIYTQGLGTSATLANGYPSDGLAGTLEVFNDGGNGIVQRYTARGGAADLSTRVFYERRYQGSLPWQPWRAYASQRVDVSLGRRVFTWDDYNNREQMIYGETGWRDIEGLLINGWTASAGQIRIRRSMYQVHLRIAGASPAAATSDSFAKSISGFNTSFNQGWFPSGGPLLRQQAGEFQLINRGTSVIYANISWPTDDPWPSVLPGNPVGVIPVN